MKILVPVDGSAFTTIALDYIAAHDALFGSRRELHLLTVVPAIPDYPSRHLGRAALDSYYAAESERVLVPVRDFAARHHWHYRASFATGQASQEIARIATEGKYDMVIMGTHGHGALGNVLLGSVSSGVLASCRMPLLLLR